MDGAGIRQGRKNSIKSDETAMVKPGSAEASAGLCAVAEDIWVQTGDDAGGDRPRGVVVRLPDGGLWLHASVDPTPRQVAGIRALGPVAHIVAPNRLRGAHAAAWRNMARSAQLWVSPLLPKRHPGITRYQLLSDIAPAEWQEELLSCVFRGSAALDEVMFLHRPSRSLIVTDLIRRRDPKQGGRLRRILARAAGTLAKTRETGGGVPPDLRFSFRRRAEARAARDRVLSWDFDRILIAHSLAVDTGGKAFFARAMSFLD